MRRFAAVAIAVGASSASTHADDGPSVRATSDLLTHEGALLELEPWRPGGIGLGAEVDRERTIFQITKDTIGSIEGEWFKNEVDASAKGWRAAFRLSHDFNWFRVDASASLNHYENRYAQRTYRELSLSISKTHRFSRWMLGWISLSLGNVKYLDEPNTPADTRVMLSIGTTFR